LRYGNYVNALTVSDENAGLGWTDEYVAVLAGVKVNASV
jgi:hypothetical protein